MNQGFSFNFLFSSYLGGGGIPLSGPFLNNARNYV